VGEVTDNPVFRALLGHARPKHFTLKIFICLQSTYLFAHPVFNNRLRNRILRHGSNAGFSQSQAVYVQNINWISRGNIYFFFWKE
jgi:hypothetical protein